MVGATLQGKHYIEENILQRKDDPLKWWKDHDKHHTLLSTLALKYLSIPGAVSDIYLQYTSFKGSEYFCEELTSEKGKKPH